MTIVLLFWIISHPLEKIKAHFPNSQKIYFAKSFTTKFFELSSSPMFLKIWSNLQAIAYITLEETAPAWISVNTRGHCMGWEGSHLVCFNGRKTRQISKLPLDGAIWLTPNIFHCSDAENFSTLSVVYLVLGKFSKDLSLSLLLLLMLPFECWWKKAFQLLKLDWIREDILKNQTESFC